jgi:hypothetical protein
LAIVILNSNNSDEVYNLVKNYGNRRIGLMTQCVNYQALQRNISKLHMCKYIHEEICIRKWVLNILDVENLSQKINGKLGGINSVINLKLALSRSSREDLFMFFGADVKLLNEYENVKSTFFHLGNSFNMLN